MVKEIGPKKIKKTALFYICSLDGVSRSCVLKIGKEYKGNSITSNNNLQSVHLQLIENVKYHAKNAALLLRNNQQIGELHETTVILQPIFTFFDVGTPNSGYVLSVYDKKVIMRLIRDDGNQLQQNPDEKINLFNTKMQINPASPNALLFIHVFMKVNDLDMKDVHSFLSEYCDITGELNDVVQPTVLYSWFKTTPFFKGTVYPNFLNSIIKLSYSYVKFQVYKEGMWRDNTESREWRGDPKTGNIIMTPSWMEPTRFTGIRVKKRSIINDYILDAHCSTTKSSPHKPHS
jgi:hypothetical protein